MAITDVENEEELMEEFQEIDEYIEEEDNRETVAAVSGWSMSLAIHAILLLLLTFIVIADRILEEPIPIKTAFTEQPPIIKEEVIKEVEFKEVEITIDDVVVEQPVVNQLDVVVEEVNLTEDDTEVTAEAKGREEAVSSSENGGQAAFMNIGAGGGGAGMMGSRTGGAKKRALVGGGGSRATETTVDRALQWFARHQSPNGQWDVDGYQINCQDAGPKCEPGTDHTGSDGDVASTGYAVLAFLGGGYDHRTPNRYRRVVKNGLSWLVQSQNQEGGWGDKNRNYENGIATMALAEAFAMTNDPVLREPAQRAVDFLKSRQIDGDNGYGGLGWDYKTSDSRNDMSVSGWVIMALKSAKAGDLDVGNSMEGAKLMFEKAWNSTNNNGEGINDYYKDRSGYPYTWNSKTDKADRPNRTAIGLCIGVFLGHGAGDIMMETMANDVMARMREGDADYQLNTYPTNTYYLYYSALAIFQVGGERWDEYNKKMIDVLLKSQHTNGGCFDGSWDYEGTRFHGNKTGRLLSTAYNALSLQVYYRYTRANK